MKKENFDKLLASVRQMGALKKGQRLAGSKISYREKSATPKEVREVRVKILGLTQVGFSRVIGESPSAVRHWEQGLRKPGGAATKMIRLLKAHPDWIAEFI